MSTILVVDDSAVDRQLMNGLLSKETDFSVQTAENPRAALEQLAESEIDIVITDLQMPDTDGLELVRSLSAQFPDLPAILVTAHGSEEIASAALAEGAAGYVPKAHLADRLVETVRNTLALLNAERSYEDLVNYTTLSEFRFELPNDPALIPPLVDLVQQMMSGIGHCNTVQRLRLAVALEQGLLNALYHGNLEVPSGTSIPSSEEIAGPKLEKIIGERNEDPKYKDRKVTVCIQITREKAKFIIEDEGNGFTLPSDLHVSDHGGRGLVMIRAFVHEMTFNEKGNVLTLVHRFGKEGFDPTSDNDQQFDDTNYGAEDEAQHKFGRLVSERSSRVIALPEDKLVIGRRKTCHIVLPYREVSAHHCQMYVHEGWWYVKDLDSGNGIKVNGRPVKKGRLDPGDTLTVAKYNYRIDYDPTALGAIGPNRD